MREIEELLMSSNRVVVPDSRTLVFGKTAAEDLATIPASVQDKLASDTLERMKVREPGAATVRLMDGSSSGLPGTVILEVVNDDRPFLLDSTLEELRERGLTPKLVAHPILAVARDAKGVLKEQPVLASPDTLLARESLIHIHLPMLSAADASDLKTGLAAVYEDVRASVQDFAAMRQRMLDIVAGWAKTKPPASKADLDEAAAFLDWAANNHMTLLGMREYRFGSKGAAPEAVETSGLGILRDPDVNVLRRGRNSLEMTPEILAFLREPQMLIITKANVKSRVHRRVHMDYIGIKLFDAKGAVIGELRVVGLFTAAAYNDPVTSVPYIRRKAEQVITAAGFPADSHSARVLANVLETYPRDELFQISQEHLTSFTTDILALGDRPRIRALARVDRFDRFVSVLVYVPKDRYDSIVRRRIGDWLATTFQGRLSAAYPSYPEGSLARTHFIIGRDEGTTPAVGRAELEQGIGSIVRTWADALRDIAIGDPAADALIRRHADGFSAAYREAFPVDQALEDMAMIDRLSPDRKRLVNLYRRASDEGHRASLKIFSLAESVSLSERVPLLEGLGFRVINERTYRIGAGEVPVWLHDMTLERAAGGAINIEDIDPRIEAAIMALFHDRLESDRINALVLEAGLAWREAALLRTFSRYAQQIRAPYGQDYIAETLNKHPKIAAALVGLFHARFDPNQPGQERDAREKEAYATIDTMLAEVQSLDEDRIIRLFRALVQAAVRTNFYQLGEDGRPRDIIAFKFQADKIPSLPLPRPLFEIFLHSPRVEGVHLRFGKVARGGIRWSDRPQDFRTEVLGLVKAQQVKNAVIVPVGAKGGFLPKRLPPVSDRAAWLAEGTEAYKLFIRTLLSLTDNLKGEVVTPPADTVRHDPDDPYLVVAADKGTATFSDTANALSESHGHWLGDAFASGGSAGYDHKKMGITARGAWEAVKRHFRAINIDIQKTTFTVAGVGDMSGDVFGNGMLLSEKIRLVAAFDHRDIFVDPDPDTATSFKERARMFALPRSSWQDYDKTLISRGGGVFPRSAKTIPVSPQMKAALGLMADNMTPQELINAILRAKVDLMWFGGIGTYVRATTETNADVGDRTNDPIRVTGQELGCRVVGEGANLGLTQKGRIEAARHGVRINTDAIDNSAGVNSSDVEVNIKIALATPMVDGRLTTETRNPLLAAMTDDVAKLVLRNNYLQSLAVSLSEIKGVSDIADQRRLMRAMETAGRLDRKVEDLPDDRSLDDLEKQGKGLTRPEISVLLAYAKLHFHDAVLESDVPDDPYFAVELHRYFPDAIRKTYIDAVDGHRLRREIIATGLANAVINRGGPAVAVCLAEDTGRPVADVARAYALTRDAFGVLDVNNAIDALDSKVPGDVQMALYAAVQRFTVERMLWFMRHVDFSAGLEALVRRFRSSVMAGNGAIKTWTDKGVPADVAASVSALEAAVQAPDAVLIAEGAAVDVAEAVEALQALGDILKGNELRRAIATAIPADSYERQALMRCGDSVDSTLRRLAGEALKAGGVPAWAQSRVAGADRAVAVVTEMLVAPLSLAKLMVATAAIADLATG
jgi:glutamate dehydrogenase